MAELSPGASFDPVRLADSRMLLQAGSGGGKSWALRLICEQCLPSLPVIVLDWEDEFHTLREKFDVLLAREDGDIPVEVRSAGLLARKIIDLNLSAVVALNELDLRARRHYVKVFLESLLVAAKKKPASRLVVIDEGQDVCPQSGDCDSSNAVIALASQGRKRGLGMVIATQRFSRLNKDAASECRNSMIGLTNFPDDQKRVAEMMGVNTAEGRRELATMKEGEFYVWGPAFNPVHVRKIKTGKVSTTHLDARSRQVAKPSAPSKHIKSVLGEFADLAKKADAEIADMTAAKAEIARLTRELNKKPAPVLAAPPKIVEVPIITDKALGQIAGHIEKILHHWQTANVGVEHLVHELKIVSGKMVHNPPRAIRKDSPPEVARVKPHHVNTIERAMVVEQNGSKPLRRILNALAWWENIGVNNPTTGQVGFVAGYADSGTFSTYLSRLSSDGLIERGGGRISLTKPGGESAQYPESLPTLAEYHRSILAVLKQEPLQRIIQKVIDEAQPLTIDELASATGYSNSGTFSTYLSRLSSLGLIDRGKGMVSPSDLIFPEGLQ